MAQRRTGGLVQRNVQAGTTKESDEAHDGDHKIITSPDLNQEEESDDKQSRLTLMEEVLLLGLKDKEVSIFLVLREGFHLSFPWNKITIRPMISMNLSKRHGLVDSIL